MNRTARAVILILLSGAIWFACFFAWFFLSRAQVVLGDPAYQSQKFLDAFTTPPLPRINTSMPLLVAGVYVIALVATLVFLYLDDKLRGGWIKRGLEFGLIYWALMVPWFEFYLPFNVMHEPYKLALLEGLLWLGTLLSFGLIISFIYNFRFNRDAP